MADQVSMEQPDVQNFLNQLRDHLSNYNTQYNKTYGEITARTAGYKGAGGTAAQALLPALDDQHKTVSDGLNQCIERLTAHSTNNAAADVQQEDVLKSAIKSILA